MGRRCSVALVSEIDNLTWHIFTRQLTRELKGSQLSTVHQLSLRLHIHQHDIYTSNSEIENKASSYANWHAQVENSPLFLPLKDNVFRILFTLGVIRLERLRRS
jgi:competence protein ComGF